MSKKASKKVKKKQIVAVDDPEPWNEELKTVFINDNQWQCNVTLLMDTNSLNMSYISAFNNMFITGKNLMPHIKIISNLSLATKTLENSYNFGNQKDTEKSAFVKLCNEAFKYCATDGFTLGTPVQILASLIKYHLFELKSKTCAEALHLKEYDERKKKIRDESITQIENIVKRVPSSKKEKNIPKKATKSGSKSATEKFTTLRKRNEKSFDNNYVHDVIPDEPQLYVILTGFRQADLPLALLKLQVPLVAVIKLHDLIDDTDAVISKKTNQHLTVTLNLVSQGSKITQRRYSNVEEECYLYDLSLKEFWDQLLGMLRYKDNVLLFKDTMCVKFYPHYNLRKMDIYKETYLTEDHEMLTHRIGGELQESIYQQLCFLQYDIQDLKRQHENYVKHLSIQDVEEKNSFSSYDIQHYSTIMDSVPSEIINIPLILNAILLQVEFSASKGEEASKSNSSVFENGKTSSKQNVEKENTLFSYLKVLDKTYDLVSQDEILPYGSGSQDGILPEESPDPLVLVVEGDEIGAKSYWWHQNNSVKEITCNILLCFWNNIFRRYLPLYDDIFISDVKDHNDDLFDLLKATGDLTFHEKLSNLPCNYHKLFVEDKAYTFCTDEELVEKTLRNVFSSDDTNVVSSLKATKKYHHYSNPCEGYFIGQPFDNHSYCFEEMTSDVLLQNLFNCFESFNCFDLQQDYFREKVFLRFHDRKTCLDREYLIGTLRTPIALRDFYDYTVDEEFYWLNEKELSFNEYLKKKGKDAADKELKHLQHLEKKALLKAQYMCSSGNFLAPDSIKSKIQSLPEHLSTDSQNSRHSTASNRTSCVDEYLEAYDIDIPIRVQFSERRQEILLSAYSKLLIKKMSKLYVQDCLLLQITIYGHSLYFFSPVIRTDYIHFHLFHKSGMVFYFKKNLTNSEPLNNNLNDHQYGVTIISKNNKNFGNNLKEKQVKYFEKLFKNLKFNLSLSLPNSLHVEVVNQQYESLYVKQCYLSNIVLPSAIKDEECRCSLLDGKLIKFMNDGSVIIYYPNSTIYHCSRVIYWPPNKDDILSDIDNIFEKEDTSKLDKTKVSTAGKAGKIKKDEPIIDFPEPTVKSRKSINAVVGSYECTLTTGQRISVDGETRIELEPLFCKSYTDILRGINVIERYDGTTLVHNFEGELVVNFPDGSRITTSAKFASDEILIDLFEEDERSEKSDNLSKSHDFTIDGGKVFNKIDFKQDSIQSEGFILIEVCYLTEHANFASIAFDNATEILNVDLFNNVCLSLSSKGLYTMNLDNKAELLVEHDQLIYREITHQSLPEFIIHLNKLFQDSSDKCSSISPEPLGKNFCNILSCVDYLGNHLEVDNVGEVHLEKKNSIKSICNCTLLKNNQIFIINNKFNGLEILPANTLDDWVKEAKNCKNCVMHNYGSTDHHVLLLLKPLLQNESDKWLKKNKKVKYFPRFTKPSTYNDKSSWFNPFPKKKYAEKTENPEVILVRLINRVNCNIHLCKHSFLINKIEGDTLRLFKDAHLSNELFKKGSVDFCKADKTFIDYILSNIIGRILSRVRKRVVKRLEFKKIKEYELILRERILLPYFSSSQGAAYVIILEIIDSVVEGSLAIEDSSHLEKLLKLPLDCLTDADLDFMHDKIAEFTVGNICSCTINEMSCKLRILLLAGRTLHSLVSDMMSVFFLYAENMKQKKLYDEKRKHESTTLKELLMRPLHLLTENEFQLVHDRLKNLPYCSCSVKPEKCKLKILLLASSILNDFFPNLDSIFKSSTFKFVV